MFLTRFSPENGEAVETDNVLSSGESEKRGVISSLFSSLGGLFASGGESPAVPENPPVEAEAEGITGGEEAKGDARKAGSEWRAYHQALDSAWRSFHLGEEGAGTMNALDRGLESLFDPERSAAREKAERYNRRLGAKLGVLAGSEEDVPRLVHEAWQNGELSVEGETPEEPEAPGGGGGEGEGSEETAPEENPAQPVEPPAEPGRIISDEEGMRMGREFFGTP